MKILRFSAHSAIEKKELSSSRLREQFSFLTDEELKELNFSHGVVGDLLSLPGAEKRKIFMFQSHAKLINAMKILNTQQRILVEQLSKSYFSLFMKFFSNVEVKVCTQTDILMYACTHITHPRFSWKLQLNKTVEEINVPSKFVSITTKDRAIDGFLKIVDAKTSACAVLDQKDGKIVATLTCSDLRGISSDSLKTILLPVMEFFMKMTGQQPPHPLICCPAEIVLDVTKQILVKNLHECWVVDENMRPKGLLTMEKLVSLCTRLNEQPNIVVQQ